MKRYARIHLDREDTSNEDILHYDGGIYEIVKEYRDSIHLVLNKKDAKKLQVDTFYLYEREYTEISPFEAGIRSILNEKVR